MVTNRHKKSSWLRRKWIKLCSDISTLVHLWYNVKSHGSYLADNFFLLISSYLNPSLMHSTPPQSHSAIQPNLRIFHVKTNLDPGPLHPSPGSYLCQRSRCKTCPIHPAACPSLALSPTSPTLFTYLPLAPPETSYNYSSAPVWSLLLWVKLKTVYTLEWMATIPSLICKNRYHKKHV